MRLAFVSLLMLTSCAGVHIQQLDPTGTRAVGPEGVRYYLPKPYLLVASSGANGSSGDPTPIQPLAPAAGAAGHPPGAAPAPAKPAAAAATPDAKDATAVPAASANTGFQVTAGGYTLKLVLLPDYSHPMTITESPGLFGTASMSVTLVDGWMLTSLSGSGDSKVSETLTAIASLIPAIAGVGGGGGGAKPPGGLGGTPARAPAPSLNPGLYELRHDEATGQIIGFCAVTLFQGGLTVKASGSDCTTPITVRPAG